MLKLTQGFDLHPPLLSHCFLSLDDLSHDLTSTQIHVLMTHSISSPAFLLDFISFHPIVSLTSLLFLKISNTSCPKTQPMIFSHDPSLLPPIIVPFMMTRLIQFFRSKKQRIHPCHPCPLSFQISNSLPSLVSFNPHICLKFIPLHLYYHHVLPRHHLYSGVLK